MSLLLAALGTSSALANAASPAQTSTATQSSATQSSASELTAPLPVTASSAPPSATEASAPPTAPSATSEMDLTWSAPETCPSQADVLAELKNAVGDTGKELPSMTARAVAEQDGDQWTLELETEIDGQRGTRHLEADTCEGLARAATLVLALALGEGLARRQAEAAAAAPPIVEPVRPRTAPTPQAEKTEWILLWAGAVLGTDALGGVGPGVVVGGDYQLKLLRLGGRVELTLPRTTEFVGSGGEVQSFSVGTELEACVAPHVERFQFAACATGGVVVLDVQGKGTAQDGQATIPLYGVGPGVGAQWLLHDHAFLNLGFVSRFFLARPELVVQGLAATRQIEAASVSAHLGVGVKW